MPRTIDSDRPGTAQAIRLLDIFISGVDPLKGWTASAPWGRLLPVLVGARSGMYETRESIVLERRKRGLSVSRSVNDVRYRHEPHRRIPLARTLPTAVTYPCPIF